MGQTRRISMRAFFLYGVFITAWVLWVLCGPQAARAVSRLIQWLPAKDEIYDSTAIQFRYPREFQKTLQKYKVFAKLYCEDDSAAIPGLAFTDVGESVCSQMVPQGICIAGDYMLISAYDNGANAGLRRDRSYVPQNSVLYILSYEEGRLGEFLTTLVLPDVNHVGGLAFDGAHVWIAKSSTKTLSAVSYEMIEAAACCGQGSVSLPEYDATVFCGVTASFVSYYDGRLWVGTYSSPLSGWGTLTVFLVEDEGGPALKRQETWQIPSCAQGISFLEQEGRTYMALSSSCGRYIDSTLYLYEVPDGGENPALKGSICLPPMSEELVSDGTHTYVLFESGATCYSSGAYLKCPYPVDRICALDSAEMLAAAEAR